MRILARPPLFAFVRSTGKLSLFLVQRMGRMGLFLVMALFYAATPPLKLDRLLKQIQFIGFQSMLVILLTGTFAGMVLGLQGFYMLNRVGSEAFRGGSAVTAEIGIMRITEQIDALELMGLNPFRYLIVPNLLAAIIALPLLTAMFDVFGILGGYLVGVKLLGVSGGTYFGEMASYVDIKDIAEGIYKSVSFGILLIWVCGYKGYHTGFGAEGVSKATTQAVVLSSVLILIWDYFMTSLLF